MEPSVNQFWLKLRPFCEINILLWISVFQGTEVFLPLDVFVVVGESVESVHFSDSVYWSEMSTNDCRADIVVGMLHWTQPLMGLHWRVNVILVQTITPVCVSEVKLKILVYRNQTIIKVVYDFLELLSALWSIMLQLQFSLSLYFSLDY